MNAIQQAQAATITTNQFRKIGLLIGRIVKATVNPSAKIPAYLLELTFGQKLLEEHQKLYNKSSYFSSAQLCTNHQPDELTKNLALAVFNFPRKQIGKMHSDCLVTGVQKELDDPNKKRETTIYVRPTSEVAEGSAVSISGDDYVYQSNPRDLCWEDFLSADLRIGTIDSLQIDRSPPTKKTEEKESKQKQPKLCKVGFRVRFGSDKSLNNAIGFLHEDATKDLVGKQVLFLNNLDADSLREQFDCPAGFKVLCTVSGQAALEPAKPVENGYKLA